MRPGAPATSSFTSQAGQAGYLRQEVRAIGASWRAKSLERFQWAGLGGYLLIWMLRPIFELAIAALIYAARPDLLNYAVVAIAGNAFLFNAIFYAGEILDRERMGGTLSALFLTPCSRYTWLGGFQLAGVAESLMIVAVALLTGHYAYDVAYDPNYVSLAVTLALFLAALWGLSMIFGAIGLLIKKANQLSNLIYPFTILLGGVYYPVSLLPDWLRIPARALPLGYGFQALSDATLTRATVTDLAPQLLPLAGFALGLPVLGMLAFRWLERLVRVRGELDLY